MGLALPRPDLGEAAGPVSPGAIHKTMLCERTGDSIRQNKRIDKHEKDSEPATLQSAAAPGRHGRLNPSRPSPRVWPSQSKLRLAEPGCLEKKVADEGPSGSGRAARDFEKKKQFSNLSNQNRAKESRDETLMRK